MRELIQELGLSDKVTLLGYRKDIRTLLYGADLFVFPSKREGMPVALMEAAAAGVPIKANDARGSRELVRVVETEGFLPEKYGMHQVRKQMERIYKELE